MSVQEVTIETNAVLLGDCAAVLAELPAQVADLIYADPPFGTQKDQVNTERRSSRMLQYSDRWPGKNAYLDWLRPILAECQRVLKPSGAILVHCDWRMSHWIRVLLDEVFDEGNFRNEIIWSYRRWTNSTKSLQRLHQNIYYYAASPAHEMNPQLVDYSPTTNLDQIWQARARDENGKSVYATDEAGEHLPYGRAKKGVPLGDVWEIPYLNPKARERVGYPTQKPIALLDRLLEIASRPGDLVLDPFCGSGTTLVAAHLKGRRYIGIDNSQDAVRISQERLAGPVVSDSVVARSGREGFVEKTDQPTMQEVLGKLNALPVYRNQNLDGFLRETLNDLPVGLRVVLAEETRSLDESEAAFIRVLRQKKCTAGVLVYMAATSAQPALFGLPAESGDFPLLKVPLQDALKTPDAVLENLNRLLASCLGDEEA